MIIRNSPAFWCALCVSLYWLMVFIKTVLIAPKRGKSSYFVLPRLALFLLIILWISLVWQAAFSAVRVYPVIAWTGAFCAILAFFAILYCWYHIGNAWRIRIDPKKNDQLITEGAFRYVRHPIFTLSMLLMMGSLLVVQTGVMLLLAGIHCSVIIWETYREERYLSKVYGNAYKAYISKTHRFLPPLSCIKRGTQA